MIFAQSWQNFHLNLKIHIWLYRCPIDMVRKAMWPLLSLVLGKNIIFIQLKAQNSQNIYFWTLSQKLASFTELSSKIHNSLYTGPNNSYDIKLKLGMSTFILKIFTFIEHHLVIQKHNTNWVPRRKHSVAEISVFYFISNEPKFTIRATPT